MRGSELPTPEARRLFHQDAALCNYRSRDQTMPPESTSADHDWKTAADVSWTLPDRNEITDAYWTVVAPALRADGFDPETDKPTYDWLRENGFRSLLYVLRGYHDRTFDTFWTEDLGLGGADDGLYSS